MITKHVIGRLGNQMFQYAAVRAFQIRNNYPVEDVYLDFTEVYKRSNEYFYNDLRDFKLTSLKETKMKKTIMQKFLILYSNFIKFVCLYTTKREDYDIKLYKFEKKMQPFYNKHGLYNFRLGSCDFNDSKVENKIFFGTFESTSYFDDIRDVLIKEFEPKYGILNKNVELYDRIKSSNSICVTIRRGDFVSNPENKKHFYVCTPDYFYNSIKYIQKHVDKPKFFVFSDDIEWVKNNMKFPKGTEFETGDDPVWEKLRLMYSCKHFIISNSTFSWWSQYLSRNKKKIVCAPTRWFNVQYKPNNEKLDIYDEKWILISSEKEKNEKS